MHRFPKKTQPNKSYIYDPECLGLMECLQKETLFRLIKEDKISFAALQETYCIKVDFNTLQRDWPETG